MSLLADLARAGFVLPADDLPIVAAPHAPSGGDRPGAQHAPAAQPGTPSYQDGLGGMGGGPPNPAEMREECQEHERAAHGQQRLP